MPADDTLAAIVATAVRAPSMHNSDVLEFTPRSAAASSELG